MTNKPMLSVELELLATALKADASMGASAIELVNGWAAMVKLRALLDNQPKPDAQHQGEPNVALCANAYSDMQRASKRLGQCISCGEPPEDDGVITHDPSCTLCAMEMAAYAEQPAPVAVVIPEHKVDPGMAAGLTSRWVQGWNEALAEVARLNGVKP